MKLAEALVLRADRQRKINELRERLLRVAKVQEGDQPAENPGDLLGELESTVSNLTALIKNINKTNAATPFDTRRTITDALADRDGMMLHRSTLEKLVAQAAITVNRFSRSEVKYQSSVDIRSLQKQIDSLSKSIRELDTAIQEKNWSVDLLE